MKLSKTLFTLLALAFALTGCQTTEPERERPPVEYSNLVGGAAYALIMGQSRVIPDTLALESYCRSGATHCGKQADTENRPISWLTPWPAHHSNLRPSDPAVWRQADDVRPPGWDSNESHRRGNL